MTINLLSSLRPQRSPWQRPILVSLACLLVGVCGIFFLRHHLQLEHVKLQQHTIVLNKQALQTQQIPSYTGKKLSTNQRQLTVLQFIFKSTPKPIQLSQLILTPTSLQLSGNGRTAGDVLILEETLMRCPQLKGVRLLKLTPIPTSGRYQFLLSATLHMPQGD